VKNIVLLLLKTSAVRNSLSRRARARRGRSIFDIQNVKLAKSVGLKSEGFKPDKWKNKKSAFPYFNNEISAFIILSF
jgi:hypothetical protein